MFQLLQFLRNRFSSFLWWFLLAISLVFLLQKNFYYQAAFIAKTNLVRLSVLKTSNDFKSFFALRKNNEFLLQENERLKNQISYLRQFSPKESIKMIPEDALNFEVLGAKVIYNSIHANENFFIINRGSNDGILHHMGVINSKGVVGITDVVRPNYTLCKSLLNTKFTTNPKINGINYFGEIKWNRKGYDKMYITELGKESEIKVGDQVTTSNYSSIFQEDILVGYVHEIVKSKKENYLLVECLISADLRKLDFVYVLKRKDKKEIDQLIENSKHEN